MQEEIASLLNCSHCVTSTYLRNPSSYGKNFKGDSTKKLDDCNNHRFVILAFINRLSASEVKAIMNLNISMQTAQYVCKDIPDIEYLKLTTAPVLKPVYKEKCLTIVKVQI